MEKNEYLCNMNKAEEQQFAILSSRVSSAEREKHEAQKKAKLLEQKNSVLESEKADMQRQLKESMDEVTATVKQMAQFMMGKGPVTLSDSLRDAIVAGVKEEFEIKLREEREAHAKEMQALKDFFALQLAAKDNEIAALKAKNGGGDAPGTTNPGQPVPEGMTPEDRIKQLDPEKEPELVKAVKYAKKEYPCLLHCLKNGALDFSNNSVEREIRRLAKYRNNSFFVGSPKGGARLARTLTIFANCKAYNIDPYKYLCDVFRRIKNTAKDQLVNLVAHKWQPQMAPAIY